MFDRSVQCLRAHCNFLLPGAIKPSHCAIKPLNGAIKLVCIGLMAQWCDNIMHCFHGTVVCLILLPGPCVLVAGFSPRLCLMSRAGRVLRPSLPSYGGGNCLFGSCTTASANSSSNRTRPLDFTPPYTEDLCQTGRSAPTRFFF